MISAQELAEHRADAESRMGAANGGSDGIVKRFVGYAPPDSNGYEAEEYLPVHEGPLRLAGVSNGAPASRTVAAPGGESQTAQRVTHWPAQTATFEDGDLIEITAGESAGCVWRAIETDRADQQTAYRVPVVAHT